MKNKKTGLGGKGLSVLFKGNQTLTETDSPPSVNLDQEKSYIFLPIETVRPNPLQPRMFFNQEKLKELSESIKSYGIIEPVIVNQKDEHYELIAGERRWRASKLAGLKTIPAIINNQSPDNVVEMMLIENIQREDLNLIEEARSYELILKKKKITQDKLAKSLGKDRTYITNLLRVLKLPTKILKEIEKKKISLGQAKMLVGLDPQNLETLFQSILKKNLTSREIEKRVKQLKNKVQRFPLATQPHKDVNLLEIEKKYREKLQTKINITPLKNKTGKIEISYYHYDDLLNILKKIK